jgi:predicted N-acetyltransferase YhbS
MLLRNMTLPKSHPELVIRPMEQRDTQQVSLLIQQLGYQRTEEEVSRWIGTLTPESERQAAFVACRGDNEVVGWIEASIERRLQSPPFALIGGLVVKEGARGNGIGRLLCDAAESWSWEHQVSTVRVTSRSTRLDAHRFYERNGYTTVKVSQVFEKKRLR